MTAALAPHRGLIRCPKCARSLAGPWPTGEETTAQCEHCKSVLTVLALPRLSLDDTVVSRSGERAHEGEASCFFHPEKRAELSCERCGRFLCALCDMPVGARHLCPTCLSSGAEKQAVPELVTSRTSFGLLAFYLALLPVFPPFWIIWWAGFLTAPAAVFLGFWGWRQPPSLVHGKRHGLAVAAIVLGLAELVGIVLIMTFAWKGMTHRG